jgi:hypothetical protein
LKVAIGTKGTWCRPRHLLQQIVFSKDHHTLCTACRFFTVALASSSSQCLQMSLASDGIWTTYNTLGSLSGSLYGAKARGYRHPSNTEGRVLRAHGVSQWRWYRGEGACQPPRGGGFFPLCATYYECGTADSASFRQSRSTVDLLTLIAACLGTLHANEIRKRSTCDAQ